MSDRVVKIGEGLVPVGAPKRAYPWTPFADKYREIIEERLGKKATVEKFSIRLEITFFRGMYTQKTRIAVYFPLTATKKWIVECKPRTKMKQIGRRVNLVHSSMRFKNLQAFETTLQELFDYLQLNFSRMIYEYNLKPYKERFRAYRTVGLAKILPRKGAQKG